MDLVLGIVALAAAIIITLYARGAVISSGMKKLKVTYKGLKVVSVEGMSPGIMTYLVSIITAMVGPFSFRFYPMNDLTYMLMNAIAGVFFALAYPYFSPVTSFSIIDVVEKKGEKFCVAGRVMKRKFRVLNITEKPKFEIMAELGKHRCVFEVTNPSSSQS